MSKFVGEELKTELFHDFKITNQYRNILASLSPFLIMVNAPAGTFKMTLYRDDRELFFVEFTSQDIKDSIESLKDNMHVFYPIVPPRPCQLNKGSYRLKLTATGYEYQDDSHLAWGIQTENLNNKLSYVPSSELDHPLALKIKVLDGRRR